jgi:subtilisin family serine protease
MKTSFLMLLLWVIITKSILYGQERFYIQIPDQKDIPKITIVKSTNEYKIETGDVDLNKIFSKYKITSFQKAFPSSKKESSQKIFEIECNDLALMDDLKKSFSNKFPMIHEVPKIEFLTLPNDFGYTGGFPGDQSYLSHIRAEEAWGITKGDPNVTIGVCDGYFETTHEDLENKIIRIDGPNILPENWDATQESTWYYEHGTVVCGVLAAVTNNGLGVSSIGYNCRIVASTYCNYNEMIDLSEQGVRVISISWGNYADPNDPWWKGTIQPLVDEIYENGALIVAACGNDPVTDYFLPASFNHVFSVAMISHKNELGPYNWKDRVELIVGNPLKVSTHNDSVDLAAPGWQITSCRLNNSYADLYANGTSLSAPLVAGTCGLMLSVNPCLTPDDLTRILKNTAVNIDNIPENQNYSGKYGAGRLDAYEAVKGAGEFGTAHYSNQTFYGNTLSRVGLSFDDNVTMLSTNNLINATYEVRIVKNFYLPLGATLDINVNPSNTINCQ